MKYIILYIAFVFVLPIAAHAQNDTTTPGLTPASPFYFAEQALETVHGWFLFSSEAKTTFNIDRANERLAELQQLCNDEEHMDRCERWSEQLTQQFQKRVEQAQKHVQRFAAQQGVTADDPINSAVNAADALAENPRVQSLVEKLTTNSERQQDVLQRVYEKVPADAKDGVLNAMEKSAAGTARALEAIQKHSAEMEQYRARIEAQVQSAAPGIKERLRSRLEQSGVLQQTE